MKLLITNATFPFRGKMYRGWVLVHDDRISGMGFGEATADIVHQADTVMTLDDNDILMPGLIDTHVHFREPGLEHKGDIATESAAALRGGVTSYIEMPNTKPATTTAEALADKMERAKGRSYGNYAFMLGAVDGVTGQLDRIPPENLPAVKLFLGTTTGAMSMPGDEELGRMMDWCAAHRVPVVVHAEDNDIIAANTAAAIGKYGSREAVPVGEHSAIRSRRACLSASRRAIELAHKHGTRLHIAHVSTADEADSLFSGGPIDDKLITAETTPMYLDEVFADPANRTSRHKINPAVKELSDAYALRRALADDRIDTIATDHAPHLLKEKEGGALTAASGAPSVQFALPVMLGYLAPELIAEKMAHAPAQLFSLKYRGEILPGNFADLVLLRRESHVISDAEVEGRCGWTPFDGRRTDYMVDTVWVNGIKTLCEGRIVAPPSGRPLRIFPRR